MENAFIESFSGRLRDECLLVHRSVSLAEAQAILEAWRMDYNHHRPHGSLEHVTPHEFVDQRQARQTTEEIDSVQNCLEGEDLRGLRHQI